MQGMAFEKHKFESCSGLSSFFFLTGRYESDVLFFFCLFLEGGLNREGTCFKLSLSLNLLRKY